MLPPSVAVVVPVHGRLPLTVRFLESFRQVAYDRDRYQIVVVDDGSPDDTAERLGRDYPHITVLHGNANLWWTGATNLGVRHSLRQGFDFVLTINNDALVSPNFLGYLVETAQANPRSIVGSRINYLDPPTKVWGIGGWTFWDDSQFPLKLLDDDKDEADVLSWRTSPVRVEFLTGCGTLIPSTCYHEVGLYDGRMFPHYHADSELTLRAGRRGYRILVDLRAVVWNDVPQTCTTKHLLLRHSHWYWRPVLAMHLRYCPFRHLFKSLFRQYGKIAWDQFVERKGGKIPAPALCFKSLVQRLLRPAA